MWTWSGNFMVMAFFLLLFVPMKAQENLAKQKLFFFFFWLKFHIKCNFRTKHFYESYRVWNSYSRLLTIIIVPCVNKKTAVFFQVYSASILDQFERLLHLFRIHRQIAAFLFAGISFAKKKLWIVHMYTHNIRMPSCCFSHSSISWSYCLSLPPFSSWDLRDFWVILGTTTQHPLSYCSVDQ